jgi:glycerophosphoryl diester phosphodiesterase
MFLRIGHRGARAYEPENTIKSFEKAIELGVNAIEFDVRETIDKKLIVFHDDKINRLTKSKGLVKNLTLKEIKSLRVGTEPIPTFQEVLEFIDEKVEKILIELKVPDLENMVLKEIKKRWLSERVIIVSFLDEVLEKIRALDKKIETGLIYVVLTNPIKKALELKANYLLPLYYFTHQRDIQKAHERGLKVIVWTINKKAQALKYGKKGVDGIVSDKPDILVGIKEYDC